MTQVLNENPKNRKALVLQKQIDETERVEMMLANYAHSLTQLGAQTKRQMTGWKILPRLQLLPLLASF